jgi:hypothetical protein
MLDTVLETVLGGGKHRRQIQRDARQTYSDTIHRCIQLEFKSHAITRSSQHTPAHASTHLHAPVHAIYTYHHTPGAPTCIITSLQSAPTLRSSVALPPFPPPPFPPSFPMISSRFELPI